MIKRQKHTWKIWRNCWSIAYMRRITMPITIIVCTCSILFQDTIMVTRNIIMANSNNRRWRLRDIAKCQVPLMSIRHKLTTMRQALITSLRSVVYSVCARWDMRRNSSWITELMRWLIAFYTFFLDLQLILLDMSPQNFFANPFFMIANRTTSTSNPSRDASKWCWESTSIVLLSCRSMASALWFPSSHRESTSRWVSK